MTAIPIQRAKARLTLVPGFAEAEQPPDFGRLIDALRWWRSRDLRAVYNLPPVDAIGHPVYDPALATIFRLVAQSPNRATAVDLIHRAHVFALESVVARERRGETDLAEPIREFAAVLERWRSQVAEEWL